MHLLIQFLFIPLCVLLLGCLFFFVSGQFASLLVFLFVCIFVLVS